MYLWHNKPFPCKKPPNKQAKSQPKQNNHKDLVCEKITGLASKNNIDFL